MYLVKFLQIIFFFSFFLLTTRLEARPVTNLERIQKAVNKKEDELREIIEHQIAIEKDIKDLKEQGIKLDDNIKKLHFRLKELEVSINNVKDELVQIELQREKLKEISVQRFRTLFMKKEDFHSMKLALLFSNTSEYLRDSFFLSKFEMRDKATLIKLLQLSDRKEEILLAEQKLVSEQEQVLKDLDKEKIDIDSAIKEQMKLKDHLVKEERKLAKVVDLLRAEALRLETVVRSLTGEEGGVHREAKDVVKIYGDASTGKFIGNGLKRGKLLMPVKGKIIKKFGEEAQSFTGIVTSKGWVFSADSQSKVVAISSGKVMYIGNMPAYGLIIILDHGNRYYSLYGQLEEVLVSVGDIVDSGEEIARTGDKKSNIGNFYFEIRKQGISNNPARYY